MNGQPALILDVSRTQGQVTAGLSETGATVQHYSSTEVNWAEISAISYSLIGLVEKSGQLGPLSAGAGADLKKSGRLLFEKILPVDIKRRLATASPVDLTLQIDEQLVFVPWEMLFDGEDFLCLRFNLGRCVKTRQPFARTSTRPPASPLRMLIIGDPKNDLPAAAREASRIRQELAEAKSIVVTSKTSNVLSRYVVRNIHGCDILHYAGHAEYDFADPANSGWLFADVKLSVRELMELGAAQPLPYVIFINACRSALAPVGKEKPDTNERQLFGMANILLAAGTRYVIGSLGRVADESALGMASLFYRHLAEGQPVGSAFRNARRDFRAGANEDDLAWAGYILYGVPDISIVNGTGPSAESRVPDRQFLAKGTRVRTFAILLGAALILAAGWYGAAGIFLQGRVHASIVAARQALAAGEPQLAIKHYEQALSDDPGEPSAALELARVYGRMGEHGRAAEVLKRSLTSEKSGRGSALYSLRYALAAEYYVLRQYEQAATLLQARPKDGSREPAGLASLYELLGHTKALARDHKSAEEWYEKARRVCLEHSLYQPLVKIDLARADNAWERYLTSVLSSGKEAGGNSVDLQSVAKLYEEAGELAVRQNDITGQARVAEGLAKIYRLESDWDRAVAQYQNAVSLWRSLPVLTWEEKARMMNACLELASGYVHPRLKFSDALNSLEQFRKLAESFKGIPAEQAESMHILQRKFELFLSRLSGLGYRHSDLYKRSVLIYDRFMSIPYLDTGSSGQ